MQNTPQNDEDEEGSGEDAQLELLEGIEEAATRIADALERRGEEKPELAPVVQVSPQIHMPDVKRIGAWAFTFQRDEDGRLSGCTAVAQ